MHPPRLAQVLRSHPAVDRILDAAHRRDALVLRALVGLAVVEAVVEEQRRVGVRRHGDVEPPSTVLR